MPASSGNNSWIVWVPEISEDNYLDYKIYTGGGDMDSKARYFPGPAGANITDPASMELGDNFTVEIKGWVDTDYGSDKNLINKRDAIEVYVSDAVSGNITTDIEESEAFDTDEWTDVGAGIGVDVGDSRMEFDTTDGGESSYREITAVSDESWLMDFEYKVTTNAGPAAIHGIGLIDSPNGDWQAPGAHDALFMRENNLIVEIRAWDGGAQTDSDDISISLDTTYYVSLERLASDNISLSFYSDTQRTSHIAGSPVTFAIPATITDLDTLEVAGYTGGIQSAGWIDELSGIFPTAVSATATGVSSGERTITVNGTANDPTWATGDVLHFVNGDANSNIDCGAIHNGAAKLWVSCWFKLDEDWGIGDGEFRLWGKNNAGTILMAYFSNALGGVHSFFNGAGGWDISSAQTSFTGGQWYHLLTSLSDTNGVRLILDNGTPVTNASVSAAPAAGNFVIGNRELAEVNGFPGVIANVIVGTDDLTPAEEAALYEGTAPGDEVNYWYIDEGAGTNIVDYGTGGNNATKGATPDWQTSTYTTGKTGRLCDFTLQVDDDRWGTNLKGVSVPDNKNNWHICENNVMPYMEYYKHYVDGVLQSHIEWEYDDTTFTDLSGNDNDAYPSFRTTSSDADVRAEIINFEPISEAIATSWSLTVENPLLTTTPSVPDRLFGDINVDNLFLGSVYDNLVSTSNHNRGTFWYPVSMLIVCVLGMLIAIATRSLLAQTIIMGIVLAVLSFTIIAWWVILVFSFYALGINVMAKQWGTI